MHADIQIKNAAIIEKNKLNSVFVIYRVCPKMLIFAMKFVSMETRIERILYKNLFSHFGFYLYSGGEVFVIPFELRWGKNFISSISSIFI